MNQLLARPTVDIIERCHADPLWFGTNILRRARWFKQKEMRRALDIHRRIHVRSANSVGKTFELGSEVCEWLITTPGGRAILTGPSFDAVKDGVWQEVVKAFNGAAANGINLGGRMGDSDWLIGPQWDAAVLSVDKIDSIHGRRGTAVLVVIDEAQGLDRADLWDALEALMTDPRSRMIASGNPIYPAGRFFDNATSPEWHSIHIDGLEHPNVVTGRQIFPGAISREWVEEKRRSWGETDPRWIARVRGQFPAEGGSQLVPLAWLDAACTDPVLTPRLAGKRMGLDVARYGGDRNVLVFIENGTLIRRESWTGQDLMETAGRLIAEARKWDCAAENVKVDVCGLGAGVVDRCNEAGFEVDAVDFGGAPKDDWPDLNADTSFKNRRAELHWTVREFVRLRELVIPRDFHDVRSDLTAPRYDFPGGVTRIEEKDAIKKRLGRSPDAGDAIVLAMSNSGNVLPFIGWVD